MNTDKQETVFEWLDDKLRYHFIDDYDDVIYFERVISKAKEMEKEKEKVIFANGYLQGEMDNRNLSKEMEKERIINAWKAGDGKYDKVADKLAEQYYNETYGGCKQ